jgi:hypothetical protein
MLSSLMQHTSNTQCSNSGQHVNLRLGFNGGGGGGASSSQQMRFFHGTTWYARPRTMPAAAGAASAQSSNPWLQQRRHSPAAATPLASTVARSLAKPIDTTCPRGVMIARDGAMANVHRRHAATTIERDGFLPSTNGCLGRGVYVAREEKARRFAQQRARETGSSCGGLVEHAPPPPSNPPSSWHAGRWRAPPTQQRAARGLASSAER